MSLDPDLAESLASIRRGTIRKAAKEAVSAAGAIDADVVDVFLKRAGDAVKLTDDLEVVGVADALERFKAAHPALFKSAAGPESTPKLDFSKGDADKALDAYARSLSSSRPMTRKLDFSDPKTDADALLTEYQASLEGDPE